MYCPECGFDAGEANFCPQCGNDLTVVGEGVQPQEEPGVCPECATEAGDARFCPDCGSQMPSGRSSPQRREKRPAADQTRGQRPRAARRGADRREPQPRSGSRHSVALIWLGFAVAAVVVVLVIFFAGGGRGGSGGSTTSGPIAADTSGSYSVLVGRANDLYDQGVTAFGKNDDTGGVAYFKAAAEVYRAAWKKKPGDPNVGTDFAVSLFYMRHHDEALKQIAVVLKKSPDFQAAHLNQGIFLQAEASEAKERGEKLKAAEFLAQARTAFEKAVSIDPSSEAGKNAAEQLKSL